MSVRNKLVLAFLGVMILAGIPGVVSIWTFDATVDRLSALRAGHLVALQEIREFTLSVDACRSRELKLRILRLPKALDGFDTAVAAGSAALASLAKNPASLSDAALSDSIAALWTDWKRFEDAVAAEKRMVTAGHWSRLAAHADAVTIPLVASILDRAVQARERIREQSNRLTIDLEEKSARAAAWSSTLLICAIFTALLATAVLSAWITRPIARLKIRALRMSKGDFGADIPIESEDELGNLTRAFNYMQSQLKELDRMKTEFISIASHEIRGPVMHITGWASILHAGRLGQIPEKMKEPLDTIKSESDRLLRLVDLLLNLSRMEAGKFEIQPDALDAPAFFGQLAEAFKGTAETEKRKFSFSISSGMPPCAWDADRIAQVINNLLNNALKFTPEQGTIRLDVVAAPPGVVCKVSDTGPGIPPDKALRVFDKFYQIDHPGDKGQKGLGLGLTLAKGIVEAHGGSIEAESRAGQGATFIVRLPAKVSSEKLKKPAGQSRSGGGGIA